MRYSSSNSVYTVIYLRCIGCATRTNLKRILWDAFGSKKNFTKQTTVWWQTSTGGIVMQEFQRQVKLYCFRGPAPVFGLINSSGIGFSWCFFFGFWFAKTISSVTCYKTMAFWTGFPHVWWSANRFPFCYILEFRRSEPDKSHTFANCSHSTCCAWLFHEWGLDEWIMHRCDWQVENSAKSRNCSFSLPCHTLTWILGMNIVLILDEVRNRCVEKSWKTTWKFWTKSFANIREHLPF